MTVSLQSIRLATMARHEAREDYHRALALHHWEHGRFGKTRQHEHWASLARLAADAALDRAWRM